MRVKSQSCVYIDANHEVHALILHDTFYDVIVHYTYDSYGDKILHTYINFPKYITILLNQSIEKQFLIIFKSSYNVFSNKKTIFLVI